MCCFLSLCLLTGSEVLAVESEARAKEVVAWRKQQQLQV